MRTYIFTKLEREILRGWLKGEIDWHDIRLRKILSRMRLFKDLSRDVELYLSVKRRLAEPKAA